MESPTSMQTSKSKQAITKKPDSLSIWRRDYCWNLSYDQISGRLGIPLESQQTARFDVVKVVAQEPTTVFESTIARTTQNEYTQPGGGVQTLIGNRGQFSAPVVTGTKLP